MGGEKEEEIERDRKRGGERGREKGRECVREEGRDQEREMVLLLCPKKAKARACMSGRSWQLPTHAPYSRCGTIGTNQAPPLA